MSQHEFNMLKEKYYGRNMIFIMSPRHCHTDNVLDRCYILFPLQTDGKIHPFRYVIPQPLTTHNVQIVIIFFMTCDLLTFLLSFSFTIITSFYHKLYDVWFLLFFLTESYMICFNSFTYGSLNIYIIKKCSLNFK